MDRKRKKGLRQAVDPIKKKSGRFFAEFKAFAMRGNVIDLAVGVIIGAAFGKITTSLVNDLIMPIIGLLLGPIDFSTLFLALDGNTYPARTAIPEGVPVLEFGSFLSAILDFFIIAFFVFLTVKFMGKLHLKHDAPPPPPHDTCPFCKSDIPVGAVRCPYCTSALTDAPSPSGSAG